MGSWTSTPASTSRIPSAAAAISGECAATLTGRTMARLAPSDLGHLGAGLDRGPLAGHDDLAGRIPIGDDERAMRGGAVDQLRQACVVETDERGHRPVAALAGRLHQLDRAPRRAGRRPRG